MNRRGRAPWRHRMSHLEIEESTETSLAIGWFGPHGNGQAQGQAKGQGDAAERAHRRGACGDDVRLLMIRYDWRIFF
eukprot:CAMPEP_0119529870 /NCGR_PEP_ID=MMETSP1344-20130328/43791_1 /TAXON_ID=236787 /ORGANISM="Florenciella parvula, Strain CCMP2471" /LENGTH=76 /DNA_ID=CAMNT_0007569605 /DNA_START=571 /DNA_END=802 /DNA_ORIENTATION=+